MDLTNRAKELFKFFDVNGDGFISRGEFVTVVEILLGEKGLGASVPHFSNADKNSDNKISFDEFIELLKTIEIT